MTFLPLIERELRSRARNRATYWTRFTTVLVATIICLPEMLTGEFGATAANSGKFIFNGIVIIGFLLACCGGFLTADVISRERRDGTLVLLLLTRVKRLDVLLGKFGSAGFTSVCALAALLPLMMIPVLAGGVTGGEAFRKGLALLNSLFLALAAGLWASAGSLEQSRAIARTIRMMIALIIIPLVVEPLFQVLFAFSMARHNPILGGIFTLVAAGDSTYKTSPGTYWISLALVHAAAWGLLIAAGRFLRDAAQSEVEIIPDRFAGDENYKSLKRRWRLGWDTSQQNPIEFLMRQQRGIGSTLWAAALLGIIFQLGLQFLLPFGFWSIARWLPLNMATGALLAWAMSRLIIESRRSGAFELLMTTPVGASTIISSQWNGLIQSLRWPFVAMLVPYLLQVLMVGWRGGASWPAERVIQQWAYIFFGIINTVFGIAALCWAGLWFGLKARNQITAIVWTVGIAKGVPFFIYLVSRGLFVTGIFNVGILMPYDVRWYIPQLLTLLFYVRLMIWVRTKFLEEMPGAEPLRFTPLRLVSQETIPAKIVPSRQGMTARKSS